MTAAEWEAEALSVPREIAAARLIVASQITGIPHRPYLLGQSDHSPVVRGVTEFCAAVYEMLDNPGSASAAVRVREMMETFR